MDIENQEAVYCEDDGEYRLYCNICDELCFERFFKNHLNSGTHINNIRKKENSIYFTSNLTEPKQ